MAIKREVAVVKLNSETIMSTSCITRSNVMNTKKITKSEAWHIHSWSLLENPEMI